MSNPRIISYIVAWCDDIKQAALKLEEERDALKARVAELEDVHKHYNYERERANKLEARIKEAFLSGYSQGNHASIESLGYNPDESADEYMEQLKQTNHEQGAGGEHYTDS